LELTLSGEFGYWKGGFLVDLNKKDIPKLRIVHEDELFLAPKDFILAMTEEEVEIPPDKLGLVTLRSTVARLGILMAPTTVSPCFKGKVVLELYHAGSFPILLKKGQKIAKLRLIPNDGEECYKGRYQNQQHIEPPKLPL